MSLAWSSVKALSIPVGGVSRDVKRVSIGGVALWEKPNPLPYDAEVEYIESTGTQYVDTGIAYSPGMRTELDIKFGSSGNMPFFGARTAANKTKCYNAIYYNSASGGVANRIRFDYCDSGELTTTQNLTPNNSVPSSSRITLAFDGATMTYPGGSLTATLAAQSFSTDCALYLFGVNTTGTASLTAGATITLYGCQMRQSGALVRDYIPVRVGSGASAVGYLYDQVSGTLFGNAADSGAGFPSACVGPDANT